MDDAANGGGGGELEIQRADPMEFLCRGSWSVSSLEASKAAGEAVAEDPREELSAVAVAGSTFSFASSATSQLLLERIMSQSQEISPLTSGRVSHSSGPLNGGSGSFSDSPPLSPHLQEIKYCKAITAAKPRPVGTTRTVGRWLKDRRERRKEEARAHNAQLHAAVSVAGVAAAVAAVAAATAASSGSGSDERAVRTDMAVASAATLVAAQCVEAAEAMAAEREQLASVVGSAVHVRTPGDIVTLTAAAATALRGAATLKARALKDVWNVAAVTPVEKGGGIGVHNSCPRPDRQHHQQHQHSQWGGDDDNDGGGGFDDHLGRDENFPGLSSQELLARGTELLKRTRKGALHWKIVSVYINRMGQVMLKTKSRHIAGTITKKKKCVIIGICRDIPAWPGLHRSERGELQQWRCYFGLRTAERRVIEFECRSQRDYELWTQGVSRLLSIVGLDDSRR